MTRPNLAGCALAVAALCVGAEAAAQTGEFYAGKRLTVIVGVDAGGTIDTLARAFAVQLRKHIPGNPTIVVQNMPGAGSTIATNYVYERAAPDGLTILYNSWDPLAQALGDQLLRARYDQFEYLGGTGDIRVNYARTDTVPGGIKAPRDIVKADNVILGALNKTDISGLLPQARAPGARRQAPHDRRLSRRPGRLSGDAARRGPVPFHQHLDLPQPQRRLRQVRRRHRHRLSGGVDRNGGYEKSRYVTEMPAFPDLYKEVHGRLPAGPDWDALNWLTNQTGEMTYVGFAPRGTPPAALAALRAGLRGRLQRSRIRQRRDQAQRRAVHLRQVPRGQAIFRSLADVTPEVLATLKAAIAAPN